MKNTALVAILAAGASAAPLIRIPLTAEAIASLRRRDEVAAAASANAVAVGGNVAATANAAAIVNTSQQENTSDEEDTTHPEGNTSQQEINPPPKPEDNQEFNTWQASNNPFPNGVSWVNTDAYLRAYIQWLCSAGWTQYCPSNVDPNNKPPCPWDPEYCQQYDYYNKNPVDFYGAPRIDPYTGQRFDGGLQQCSTDEDGQKVCVG